MDVPKLLEAIGGLAWPLLAAVVLWHLFPLIREVVKSRGFTIKVGDMEVTVQEASEQIRQQIEDLQKKVSELRTEQAAPAAGAVTPPASAPAVPRRILWVDDQPANNAFEIARLKDDSVDVIEATSTDEALRLLVAQRTPVAAVISDMGRREAGTYRPRAGIDLIQQARTAGVAIPIFVYSSARGIGTVRDDVLGVGGTGVTASTVELFEMLRQVLPAAA